MKIPIGICTCGNRRSSKRLITSLISEYSKSDIDKMLDSNFGKQNTYHLNLIYDKLNEAIINKNQTIFLEAATGNYGNAINELALWLSHKWKVGEEIKVKFLNRAPYLELLVKQVANEWMKYANIKFVFVENEDAEVRIEFDSDNTYWSAIGTLCRQNKDQSQATMHLGAFNLGIDEGIIKGVFLHEFGHVLGCIHEHQHPVITFNWDEEKVIEYYAKEHNWDEAKTRHNILNKLPTEDLTNSDYDSDSIMHYFFPSELTSDNSTFSLNTTLSQKDIDFISFCYSF